MESFGGWTIETIDGWVHLKKGSKGTMIALPKDAKLSESRKETKNIRLKDLESVWGDEESTKITRLTDTLKLTFDVNGTPYIFTFLSYEADLLVIHGWAHWDGDIWGFHIERLS